MTGEIYPDKKERKMGLSKEDRRAAKVAWRERERQWSIVCVTIGTTRWLRLTADPAALERRLGFSFRSGAGAPQLLIPAYKKAGTHKVEVVEELDADLSDMARDTLAEARLAHWEKAFSAKRF